MANHAPTVDDDTRRGSGSAPTKYLRVVISGRPGSQRTVLRVDRPGRPHMNERSLLVNVEHLRLKVQQINFHYLRKRVAVQW